MPEPGWYQDPYDQSQTRWFDGTQWTGHTHPLPTQPQVVAPEAQQADPLAATHQPLTEQQADTPWQSGAGLNTVAPPDMQSIAARSGESQQFQQGVAEYYQPPSPTQQAAQTISTGGVRRTPSTMWTGMIAILVGFITSIILGIAGAVVTGMGLLGGAGGVGATFLIFLVLSLVGQLWLIGFFTAYFFNRKNYYYPSRWNLVAGYIVTSLAFGATAFVLALLTAAVVGKSGGGAIGLLLLLLMIPLYVYLAGKLINLATKWSVNTGKIITIASAAISIIMTVIIVAVMGTAIMKLKDAAENNQTQQMQQMQQGVPNQQEMQKQFQDQMKKQGVPEDQQQQLMQQMQQQSQ